jgi:hypothetical protein
LRDRARERLFPTFWTNDELNDYIVEALRIWNVLTGYWKASQTVTVPAGTLFYSLPDNLSNFLALSRIEVASSHLNQVSLQELDSARPEWQYAAAAALSEAALIGLDRIAFSPPPDADISVTFFYIRTAIVPVADTDFIQLSEEELKPILDFVTFIATLKEGGDELQTNVPLLKSFLHQCSLYNSKLNSISVFRKLLGWSGYKEARPEEQAALGPRAFQNPSEALKYPAK